MSTIKRIHKLVCLATLLLYLIASPGFLTNAFAGKRKAKQSRDRAVKSRASVQTTRRRGSATRETPATRRRQKSIADLRKMNRRVTVEKALASKVRARKSAGQRRTREPRHTEVALRAEIEGAKALERGADETLRSQVQSMIAMDETTGEDAEVRRVAVNALGHHAGTVVVMDPNTGRIYSIVNQQWALREGFKPCSTIKLVTGLAGLNEKLIETGETTSISANNQMDLTRALAHSNNGYFQQVGGRVGFEKMLFYARQLGLGEKTGINARNEFAGRMPGHKQGFALNRMSSHGDDFEVTALQLTTLVSAMTNGGKLLSPHVPRTAQEQVKFKPRVRRVVKIDAEVWSHMVPGMIGAVNYGSGRRAYDPLETIAGKTGTCIEQGTWVGLFASYAPLSNPRLAVVVIGRGSDGRRHFPAAVAGQIYRNLSHRFGMPNNQQAAGPKARGYKNATMAYAHEEDRVEALEKPGDRKATTHMSTSEVITPRPLWVNRDAEGNTAVRPVLMSIPNRTEESREVTVEPTQQQATRPRRVGATRL
jgi:penicillin-binding protein 2